MKQHNPAIIRAILVKPFRLVTFIKGVGDDNQSLWNHGFQHDATNKDSGAASSQFSSHGTCEGAENSQASRTLGENKNDKICCYTTYFVFTF